MSGKEAKLRRRAYTFFLVAVLPYGLSIVVIQSFKNDAIVPAYVLAAVGVACTIGFIWNYLGAAAARVEDRETRAKGAVDAAVAGIKNEHDLLGLMRANRKQMDAYDAQARAQGVVAHWISVGAMVVGLIIVGVGLWVAVAAEEPAAKYSAAIVAAVGTATGGYIAQTFIRLNSEAQDQVRFYFEQPLVQSYLLTAERFVAQMPAEDRAKQYQRLIEAAIEQAANAPKHRLTSGGRDPNPNNGESSTDAE